MDNPLEQQAPKSILERAHEFARDMAYGVSVGKWGTKISLQLASGGARWKAETAHIGGQKDPFWEYIETKWNHNPPSHTLMDTLGYFLTDSRDGRGFYSYILSKKCFDLLEKPPTSPNTFISYRRGHSTGFALYLEARLRLAGNNAVYVDKALEPGSQWRDVLTEKINQSKFMIVLCTHGTFDGDPEKNWVFREVRMAQQAGCAIIPILHPAGRDDFNARDIPNSPELDALRDSQVIKVQDATAAEYEVAANKLLSYMGYSTY